MKAFITGSQAYGEPNEDSDIDLVVFVTPNELTRLRSFADSDDREKKTGDSDSGPQHMGGASPRPCGSAN